MNARELSIRVRDALLLLEEREAGQPATLIDELEDEAAASLRAVQNLIDAMARQRRLWLANGMDALLLSEGEDAPGAFSRRRWREIQEAFNALGVWMETPLPGCGAPPLVIVSRRGNPPEPVVALPEPQPEPQPEQPDPEPEGGE